MSLFYRRVFTDWQRWIKYAPIQPTLGGRAGSSWTGHIHFLESPSPVYIWSVGGGARAKPRTLLLWGNPGNHRTWIIRCTPPISFSQILKDGKKTAARAETENKKPLMCRLKGSSRWTVLRIPQMTDTAMSHAAQMPRTPLRSALGGTLRRLQWRKMIIIADEAEAANDDSVTAESFLICRIRSWHAPSRGGGNLFICAEERGKGGQLASTIRHPCDKRYITAWDSQTNERQQKCSSRLGRTLQSPPCSNHTYKLTDAFSIVTVAPHIRRLPMGCHVRSGWLKGTPVMSNVLLQNHAPLHSIKHMQFRVPPIWERVTAVRCR